MTTPTTDRRLGLNGGAAIKVPCRAATTANITLSGEQTVDGVACVTGDRVLVKNQTDQTTNGVYDVSTAAWTRSYDYNGNFDVVTGTIVMVISGTTNINTYWRLSTTGTITIGTSNLTYEYALAGDAAMVGFIQSGTGAVATNVSQVLSERVSVFRFMTAAQIADVQAGTALIDVSTAIQVAIDVMYLAGGGSLYFPSGIYYVTTPIRPKSYVNMIGDNFQSTIIKKDNTTTYATIDCVIYAKDCTRFKIDGIGVDGMDIVGEVIASAHSFGFYMEDCSYFDVTNTKARYCVNGYKLITCYVFGLELATAQQCLQYGYKLESSCTSGVLRNTTAWGCGGGWSINQTVYTTLVGCACDHSDAGGTATDPFLPYGSGGNYQATAYVFQVVSSQGITIVSPGCESSYSQYIYGEGAYVTVIQPYIYNLQCYDPTWNFIATRQTGTSRIILVNPYGFSANVVNQLAVSSTIRGLYVETPSTQEIKVLGSVSIGSTFGAYAYSATGIVFDGEDYICNYTARSMAIGENSSFNHGASDISQVVWSGTAKELQFDSVSANVVAFDQLLPSSGLFTFAIIGTYSSAYGVASLALIETNGATTNILKSWTNSGASISINEAGNYTATTGYSLYFRITTNHTTDVMKFTNFVIKSNTITF